MDKELEESILDYPREEGLDRSLWERKQDGTYTLTTESKAKIMFVIKWMTRGGETSLGEFGVNLVGSMTSNSYSDTSDIDLHFNSPEISEDDAEEFNRILRKRFEEEFKSVFTEEDWTINGHPIEVYFQINPAQDLMSVGCYDVLKDEWRVGPELKDPDFDPYSEYYHEGMKYVHQVVEDIRNVILQCFESAVVLRNSKDGRFREFEMRHLEDRLSKAANIFTQAREYRKLKSSPRSEEQSKVFRDSRDWKIADSSFKMLDKFGYLGILKTMTECHKGLNSGEMTQDQVLEEIISSISDNFSNNVNLDENEKMVFEELQEESLKDVVKYAMLMGALSSPALGVDGSQRNEIEKNVPRRELSVLKDMVGDMSYRNTLNCIAWTIWTEARGEYRRNGVKSLNAIASVIWNRADQDPKNFSKVIGQPKQFSWWNDYTGGFKEDTYVSQSPTEQELKDTENRKIWELCNRIANDMMSGNFKSTIGNLNSYLNKDTADRKAVDSWGRKCNYRIGRHSFGYLREWDGKRKFGGNATQVAKTVGVKTHIVSKGDTIGTIASRYNTSVGDILKKNPEIKDRDVIRIGQKIKV